MEPRQQLRRATTVAACGSEPNRVLKCGVAAVAWHGTLWSSSKRPLNCQIHKYSIIYLSINFFENISFLQNEYFPIIRNNFFLIDS
jgi:hypothetical protein